MRSYISETPAKTPIHQASLEENIYRVETSYLEDTSAGNIIKGFDNYIKGASGPTTDSRGTVTRRKGGITDADRIFSRSSANFVRVRSLLPFKA